MSFCPKCGARYRDPKERPGAKCPLDGEALEAEAKGADPTDPLIGRTLGACKVLAPLAEGRTSRLFLGKSTDGKEVVLKVLDGDLCRDRELAARYTSAASLAELRDPEFFVRVLGSGMTDEGLAYVVMERFVGRTLEERLAAGPVFEIEGAEIAAGIAEALATLHRRARGHGALTARKVIIEEQPEDATFRVRLLDASATRAQLPPPTPAASPEDDMRALGELIRKMVDGTPGLPILALAARLESPEQDKGLAHADAFLAALNKKGSGVLLSRPPTPSSADEPKPASERPTRAPSRRPSSVTTPPPIASVPRGRIAIAASAAIIVVILFWLVAGRGPSKPSETASPPPTPAVVAAPPRAPTPPDDPPLVIENSAPGAKPPSPVPPSAPKKPEPPAPDAIDARFVELDAKLGDALKARGLGFEDLSAVEANRTRQWGRWFKKAERPTLDKLEATHEELLGAIDRAAKAKAARAEPKKAPPKKPPPKKTPESGSGATRSSSTS